MPIPSTLPHAPGALQLLLGYLPPDPSGWDELLARKRTQYLLFCEVRAAAAGQLPCSFMARLPQQDCSFL